jgi:hypothetical protein
VTPHHPNLHFNEARVVEVVSGGVVRAGHRAPRWIVDGINTLVGTGGNIYVTAGDAAAPWSDPKWLRETPLTTTRRGGAVRAVQPLERPPCPNCTFRGPTTGALLKLLLTQELKAIAVG